MLYFHHNTATFAKSVSVRSSKAGLWGANYLITECKLTLTFQESLALVQELILGNVQKETDVPVPISSERSPISIVWLFFRIFVVK